jgi:tetratricopeptide (TPR) repeat protein
MLILADSLARLAQVGETGWDRDKAHEAIKLFRQVQQRQPTALLPANNIAWLEVKALGQADDAFESAAPLRAKEKIDSFPPDFFETLGVIEVARSNFDEGRKYLERAVAGPGPKASYYYHLAQAYHGLRRQDKAEEAISRAGDLPKTPREQAEYLEIANTIRKTR